MSSHAEHVGRYSALRRLSIRLNSALVKSLDPQSIPTIAGRFGMLEGRQILLETDDESAVLMDSCIHDYRVGGENAAQRYLREHPPAEGSDERLMLEALARARYSIFEARHAEAGVGVECEDLLYGGDVFIWDISFSYNVMPGAIMAGRIFSPGPLTMSTGAFLPVDQPLGRKLLQRLHPYLDPSTGHLKPVTVEETSELSLMLVGTCIRGGASAAIRYADADEIEQDDLEGRRLTPIRVEQKTGRNEPCPCGSGKKFKKCCGK